MFPPKPLHFPRCMPPAYYRCIYRSLLIMASTRQDIFSNTSRRNMCVWLAPEFQPQSCPPSLAPPTTVTNRPGQWQRRVKDITRAILPSTSKAQPAPSTASGMGQSTKTDISSSMDCTATTTSSEESSIAGFDGPKVLNSASSGDILRCNANPKKVMCTNT